MGKALKVCYQQGATDCAAACLAMVARHHGLSCEINDLYPLFPPSGDKGVSMYAINKAATQLGFRPRGLRLDYDALLSEVALPCICHWDGNHFVVIAKITPRRVTLLDPAMGRVVYSRKEFCRRWSAAADNCGTALELRADALRQPEPAARSVRHSTGILPLVKEYRRPLAVICLMLLLTGALNLLAPFLTQWMFDSGLTGRDLNIVVLALLAQLFIIIGRNTFVFIQSRGALYAGNRIGMNLKRRLLDKFVRLPRPFFDYKGHGEVLQLSVEASNAEMFLTSHIPGTLTSLVTVAISSILLMWYDGTIFCIYLLSLVCYYLWIKMHLARKRKADNLYFAASAREREKMIQFVQGINDIKLSGKDKSFVDRWQTYYHTLFDANRKAFTVRQSQSIGISIISKLTDVAVIFVTIIAVMDGRLTVGAMMAIQYVTGSLEYPSQEIISFFRYLQDFRVSAARLNGIYTHSEEKAGTGLDLSRIPDGGIVFRHVDFKYDTTADTLTLKDINLHIPSGKTTAIVGASGSGKSTLIRMLLGFYTPLNGNVSVGDKDMTTLNLTSWRANCGFSGPESYVFNETLLFNIVLSDTEYDSQRLREACRLAEFDEVVESQPLGLASMAGHDGDRLSNGQRQRLLLARALYSRPRLLILDEATNSLDAITERKIYRNLQTASGDTTVVIAAHRLSTIRDADHIVVFSDGGIAEEGDHESLLRRGGLYLKLINNQLA